MKKNKIISKMLIMFILVMSIFSININVEASQKIEGVFDTELSEGTYKYSESGDIYLPFIRYAADRILIDKKISGFGTSFAAQSIEVNADIKGMEVLFAGDSIRVNNKMEYGVLFATTNAVISSEIEQSLIVLAGEKITISDDAVIKGDIICLGTELEINGIVEGSVIGACDNIVINGSIAKDLRVKTNSVTLDKDVVKGNIYLETYNSSLTLPESYTDAKIKVLEIQEVEFDYSIIYTAIITGAVFTLVYFVINKITKNKLFKNGIDKVKSNPIAVVFGGSVSLMTIPVVFILLILLSVVGLYMITVPVLIVYSTFLLIVGLLSTLIIGTLITEYMVNSKYLKDKGAKAKYLFAFITYILLYILARVPIIDGYVTLILVMLAIGTSICMLFCKVKNNNIENNIVNNE